MIITYCLLNIIYYQNNGIHTEFAFREFTIIDNYYERALHELNPFDTVK